MGLDEKYCDVIIKRWVEHLMKIKDRIFKIISDASTPVSVIDIVDTLETNKKTTLKNLNTLINDGLIYKINNCEFAIINEKQHMSVTDVANIHNTTASDVVTKCKLHKIKIHASGLDDESIAVIFN